MDKRKHVRFRAKEGAFAVPPSGICGGGRIIDISKGGLSFWYMEDGRCSEGSFNIDIIMSDPKFHLAKISVKTVSDFKIMTEVPFSVIQMRRCGVRFEELTRKQKTWLEYFIQNHTRITIPGHP